MATHELAMRPRHLKEKGDNLVNLRFGLRSSECESVFLIRLAVGLVVFIPEGIQKLLFPELLGSGRFVHIGIPWSCILGALAGVVETVCGLLIVFGLATRLATFPLIIILVVYILSTKVPILLGHDWWIIHLPKFERYGFWSMQHEARVDFSILLGAVFLLLAGGGRWSVNAWFTRREVGVTSPHTRDTA